jgi:large subunit ribosomal protein L29
MKADKIRELSINEIEKKLKETHKELFELHMRKQTGQVEKPSQVRMLRRDIARLETILTQKKGQQGTS